MLCKAIYLFYVFVTLAFAESSIAPSRYHGEGFNVEFYAYELGSVIGWESGFFEDFCKICRRLDSPKNVMDINYHFLQHPKNRNFNNIYNSRQTVTNMVVHSYAYFRPSVTGSYTFKLAADDGAQLTVGPMKLPCEFSTKFETETFKLKALKSINDQAEPVVSVNEGSVRLIEGFYYPVNVTSFNSQGNAKLELSVIDPLGNEIADFGEHVIQATFDECDPINELE
ncbi:hypothetical protein OXX69_003674 [Metschnikowia pulcherrima]